MRFARCLAGLLALSIPALAPPLGAATLLDRVVAVVDDDPILASDLEPPIALALVTAEPEESESALRRRVLDQLIAERLRYHEVSRFGTATVPVEEIDAQLAAIRSRTGGEEAFAARLAAAGLDEEGLRQLLARQVLVLTYVEERLGPRIFVSLDEIRSYYEATLVPGLTAEGAAIPPFDTVREEIRQLLKQERLNREVERWTAELRREADVVDLLDEPPPPAPGQASEPPG